MSGRPVTGAIPFASCWFCRQPVTLCLAPRCIGFRLVHLATRLHKCGTGTTSAFAGGAR